MRAQLGPLLANPDAADTASRADGRVIDREVVVDANRNRRIVFP